MPTKPNKKLALLKRRQQVAELALQGWSQTAIAEHLDVAQATISGDLRKVRQEWRNSTLRDFEEARAMELEKLARIEKEAWAAWDRSQKPQQSAIVSGDGTGPRNRKSLTNRYGDPRFLEQVHKCVIQRRAILGLDVVQIDIDDDGKNDLENMTPEEHRAEVLAIISRLTDRAAKASLKAPIEVSANDVRTVAPPADGSMDSPPGLLKVDDGRET